MSWSNMASGVMYRTISPMTLATSWGSLILGEGTVISKSPTNEPVLVWGQAEVTASSPITMAVIKNKLFDGPAMSDKVERYWLGELAPEDFVLIRNLHTTYEVKSGIRGVSVEVTNGSVTVSSAGKKQEVNNGQIATVGDTTITVHTSMWRIVRWIYIGIVVILFVIISIIVRNRKKLLKNFDVKSK
jgi:hypothetical protein